MKAAKPIKTIKNKKAALTLILFLLLILFLIFREYKENGNANANTGAKLGQYAPGFEAEYLNGTPISLYELRGKPIILNFWATWCPPCVREMPVLDEFQQRYENEIIVLGVNLGEKDEAIENFLKRVNVSFAIVKDKNKSIEESYNLIVRPSTFFIDKNGIIADKRLGEISKEELEEKIQKLLK